MTRSPVELAPKPVRVGRYRYSKLRWRVSVRAFDWLGGLGMRAFRLVRPPDRPERPGRVLVVQLDHLGDAVLSSPLTARLRAAYPEARIDVLASTSNHEVFLTDPNVDRVRVAERSWFERARGRSALASAVWKLGLGLRAERYDLGVDVRGDILSVLVLALAGVRRRVGWGMGGGGFLLTDVAGWIPGRHEVRSRLALLDVIGLPAHAPTRVSVHVSDADRAEVARLLLDDWPPRAPRASSTTAALRHRHDAHPRPSGGSATRLTSRARAVVRPPTIEPDRLHAGRFGDEAPLLAVHLGAGTTAKQWPIGHWRSLASRFLTDGWRVVVVGGPEDSRLSARLDRHESLRDWTGRLSVSQTSALLERADLFIGADSGPSHLAASAGTPSLILFSGTNRVAQWRPWSRRSLVLRHPVPCRPCHQKACPLADHPCMAGLDPDRVYRAARRWWARLHRQESPHAPL